MYKSFQKVCFPGRSVIPAKLIEESITIMSWCCNSFNCNQKSLRKGVTIECFLCDSRVTGLTGCSTLNAISSHVYKSGSSNPFESCAVSASGKTQSMLSYKR